MIHRRGRCIGAGRSALEETQLRNNRRHHDSLPERDSVCVWHRRRMAGMKLLLGLLVLERGACQLPLNVEDSLRYALALVSEL